MNNIIRKATSSDISRIAEILIFSKRTAYRHIFNNDKISFGEMQVLPLAKEYMDNMCLLEGIVVYDDEFVKGMANLDKNEIKEIYVDSFFQNEGIGGKLLAYIENKCKSYNINQIFLWVLEKNKSAIKFYEKHGFVASKERKIEEGTTEYIVKYTKSLGE